MEIEVSDSSLIRKFNYDSESQELRVWFTNGQVYDYFFVPEEVALAFKAVCESKEKESVGRWFGTAVRKVYVYRKVKK